MNPDDSQLPGLRSAESGRVFRITYSNARPDDEPKLFRDRDGIAFCELNAALCQHGYAYGTTIHFYPDDARALADFPAFRAGDIVVLTTRPPLDDHGLSNPRKKLWHATNALEVVLFKELSKYIHFCTRKHVQLTEHAIGCLKVSHPDIWGHLEFYEYSGAEIQQHFVGPAPVKSARSRRSTVAFFLRADHLPGINCDFVASFGMDGYGTLIWNRIIRAHFPEWLASPRFVMAELVYKKEIPPKPLTPAFVDDGAYVEVQLLT